MSQIGLLFCFAFIAFSLTIHIYLLFDYIYMQLSKQYELPAAYLCYKKSFEVLIRSRWLFQKLLLECKICIRCIFKLYNLEHPHMYAQRGLLIEILPPLLQNDTEKLKQFNHLSSCVTDVCWHCQGIFQPSTISKLVQQVKKSIFQRGYDGYKQFKLNIRVPNILILKSLMLARYLFFSQAHLPNPDQQRLRTFYNILILPFDSAKAVDFKTVLKWMLAVELRQVLQMASTAQDHNDNLTVSLQFEQIEDSHERQLMRHFVGKLGLQKKKQKIKKGRKVCLDMGQDSNTTQIRCNSYNLNKIASLKQEQFASIFQQWPNQQKFISFLSGQNINQILSSQASIVRFKVGLLSKNIFLCGRYIKYSRYLSQTPWMVDGKKLTEGSLQEQIQNPLIQLFYPGRERNQTETSFHAGGRQDIDVRMLQGGRPFVLQLKNPIRSISALTQKHVFDSMPEQAKEIISHQFKDWVIINKKENEVQMHSIRITKLLQLLINYLTPYVKVHQLQQTTESYVSVELKQAELQKVKHYLCFVHSLQPLDEQDKFKLESLSDLAVEQLTPLRVLHRRTLMSRAKIVHKMRVHLVSSHSAVIQVYASAGTYIKEFVHGDLGRTTPNVGFLIGKQIDILQLDVGSLKQGEWKLGDQNLMKMQKFAWLD